MAVRPADAQALTALTAAVDPSHVGGGPCLVDEDQMLGRQIKLAVKPGLPAPQDVGPVLLAGMRRLFLRVMAWRAKKRRIVP